MSDTEERDEIEYAEIEGVYIDEDGNPRAETEQLSKSGSTDEDSDT